MRCSVWIVGNETEYWKHNGDDYFIVSPYVGDGEITADDYDDDLLLAIF